MKVKVCDVADKIQEATTLLIWMNAEDELKTPGHNSKAGDGGRKETPRKAEEVMNGLHQRK